MNICEQVYNAYYRQIWIEYSLSPHKHATCKEYDYSAVAANLRTHIQLKKKKKKSVDERVALICS